ncbi:MFS transporter [Pengzhenrongella sicca]|uniref:MHS family MFS transporter n=1 Tax=Pengzhenrongella sicca TaxID=2819238 RepID=A0A8A4Z9C0_9MICO|nr:MFS transporter [Pengzhenrongella sicca]QTE28075.1 MHS family MFS transporter [Pengzhenrongella sicca]
MSTTQGASSPGAAQINEHDLRRAALASTLGSALEYYDFALYSLASALIFGQLFFTDADPATGRILAFATYFIGFAVRPLGGLFFGSLGDRIGRKQVLLMTVLLMGGASTLIGVLPTYQQVGMWAPALLIVLRIAQGFGAGAEQAGAATLMTEYAPPRRRGFYAALPFMGIQVGTVIAAVVFFALLVPSEEVLYGWLWRVPFLASAVLIAIAVWIRYKLKESPSFTKLEAREQIEMQPLRSLLRTSRRTVAIGIGLRMAENGGSSVYQALAISYVVTVALADVANPGPIGAIALICAATVGAVTVPVAGKLTDRFGRIPVYRGFAIAQLVLVFPVWWILSTGNIPATVAAISIALGVATWGMFGAQGALMPELFGAQHRYTGVSVARETSAVIAGGVAPLVGSLLLSWFADSWVPIAVYLALLTLITIATTFITPETRDRDLDSDLDALDELPGRPSAEISDADLTTRPNTDSIPAR